MKTALTSLEAALARLGDGQDEPALASLLDAWRVMRAPQIADAIDVLSARLTAREPPIQGKKAWDTAARAMRPAALGRLLGALPESLEHASRMKALAAMPLDPRVGTFARAWLAETPVAGKKRAPFFDGLIGVLEKLHDERLTAMLAEATTPERKSEAIANVGSSNWKPLVALAAAYAKRNASALSADETALLARIGKKLAAPRPDAASLLAQVYASPDDDEPRAVLGDLLQQQGDPRGEHIALQLARHGRGEPPTAAEKKLETKWGRMWLGAMEPAVQKSGVVFERGFVARCRYSGTDDPAVLHAPEWSTVTHLDAVQASKYGGNSAPLLLTPNARRSMQHVIGLHIDDIPKLALGAPLRWKTLGVTLWRWDRYIGPLARGPGALFPEVTKLVFAQLMSAEDLDVEPAQLGALLAKWPRVKELEIGTDAVRLVPLLTDANVKKLDRIDLTSKTKWRLAFDRAARSLSVEVANVWEGLPAEVGAILGALGRSGAITHARFSMDGKATLTKDLLRHRYSEVDITPLREASKTAGVALTVAI